MNLLTMGAVDIAQFCEETKEILGNNLFNVVPIGTLGVGKCSLLHLKVLF